MSSERSTALEATDMPDRSTADRGLRSSGMRDLGPAEMARFRQIERTFLETTAAAGCREIRTPTIEPLHLYTAAGTLSPQALDRVYSFLDWDGWSGERVVLRPDATVAVARWYGERGDGTEQRVSYVQPVYRFAAQGEREVWQCGVEFFGAAAPQADAELLLLARGMLTALGIESVTVDLAHAGLVRAAFAATGLSASEQIEAYDRVLEGDAGVTGDLVATHPLGAAALRLLSEVDGTSVGYVDNLRAAMLPVVPGAAGALDELAAAAGALAAAGVPFRVLAGTARSFEYYSGLTFRFIAGGRECVSGGRYDGLAETIGGAAAPGSGWAADILGLAEVLGSEVRS